ncbi:unnamed protein product [Mesocestoides corti]|nr:unnamed protein product [Mesocestoides corti]
MSGRFVRQHCIRGGVEFRNTLREEARMTILILCLIGAFFICQSPFVAYSACHKVGILSKPSHGHSLLRAAITLALALKSDCTFVFHCWLNQRFALALRRMLCSFSANEGSGRCRLSKSYSLEASQNNGNLQYSQTRSLVKHHAIQHANQRDKKHVKMLLKEIKHKHRTTCQSKEEEVHKLSELQFPQLRDSITFELKQDDKRKGTTQTRGANQAESVTEPLYRSDAAWDEQHQTGNIRHAASMKKKSLPIFPKRCSRNEQKFFSENDLHTSFTTTDCSFGSSCQALSSVSSVGCTAETCAHCGCSLTKTYSLPLRNPKLGSCESCYIKCD